MEEKKVKKGIKREFSAGGLVYKKEKGKLLWLIIKPHGYDRWQFPKGNINRGESSRQAAQREVEEEGGIKVRLYEKVGNSQYFFVLDSQKIFKNVVYYLMRYVSDAKSGHDWEVDEVKFLPYKQAHKSLSFKDDRDMLEKASEILGER